MHPQDRLFCEIAVQLELLTRDQVAECLRTLQRDPKGRNIGAVATTMGFLSQPEVELVLQHQQRVLDRRREARAASQGQRGGESGRAMDLPAAGVPASASAGARREPPPEGRRARLDPTPTSQWVHAEAEPALAAAAKAQIATGGAQLSPEQLASAQVRETLDIRPPSSRRPVATQLEARPDPVPDAGHARKSPAGTQSRPPRVAFTPPPARNSAAPRAQKSAPPPARSLPPGVARSLPPGVARSLPPPVARSAPPTASRPLLGGGTLLDGAALAQRNKAAVEAGPKSGGRPVPLGRDWRNPSHPPPMAAIETDVQLSRVARAETLTLPANDASLRREQPSAAGAARYLDAALAVAVATGGSDLHVHSGAPLFLRIDGKLCPMGAEAPLSRETAERVIAELLDTTQWMQLMVEGDLRFAYELPGVGRFRAHAYCQERGTDIVFRILPKQIAAPDDLGLGSALRRLSEQTPGLCVCSGPAGSGKTTSLAALTRAMASARALHIVTLESPIEFVHTAGLGLIEQREVGRHVASFAEGIELAQRQGADLIVVSDLSAPGAVEASLRAVRGRCFVLGSLRASSCAQAFNKLLRAVEASNAERLRSELACALRLMLHQRLVPRARTAGRVAAFESVVNNTQVAQLIREDKLQQLPAVVAAGKGAGMLSLDEALDELLRAGTISTEAARHAAHRRERFKTA